jgi:hypothetical protein
MNEGQYHTVSVVWVGTSPGKPVAWKMHEPPEVPVRRPAGKGEVRVTMFRIVRSALLQSETPICFDPDHSIGIFRAGSDLPRPLAGWKAFPSSAKGTCP